VRIASALAAAAACVAASGCFDFGSVSGGPPADAGPGSSEGPTDAQSALDASGDAGAQGFCAAITPKPTLCDDFDDYETSTLTNWDQTFTANGTAGLDSLAPFSKPYAFTAQTSLAAKGVQAEADVIKGFPMLARRPLAITVAFEMNIDQWDTSPTGQIVAFEVIFKNSSSQFNQIVLNLNALGVGGVSAQIAENAAGQDGGAAGYNSYPFQDHPVTKKWTKVEMTLNVPNPTGAQANTFTVKLDGVTQIDAQPFQVPLQGGPPYIHLGIGYVGTPSAPWVMHYDNFVATVTPY
jgi:hypothetical protein